MRNDALLMPDKSGAHQKSGGSDEPYGGDERKKFAGHAGRIIVRGQTGKEEKESGMMQRI